MGNLTTDDDDDDDDDDDAHTLGEIAQFIRSITRLRARPGRRSSVVRRRSSLLKLEAGRLPIAPLGRSRAAARSSLGDAAAQRQRVSVTEAAALEASDRAGRRAGGRRLYGAAAVQD